MGYDFKAKRKDVERFHLGAFSWPWMLDQGVGLIIGYGRLSGGKHCYEPRPVRNHDSDPLCNDGYPVSASEAKAMARALRGLVTVERFRAEEWERKSPEERARIEALNRYDSRERDLAEPVRSDFVDKAEAFADWCAESGGFRVY